MSKTKKLWGVSLLVLAFSFDTNAQTCKVPPTCESMGFTMTAAACNGKTILKCPFDEAKVYCPSALEYNPVYGIGDLYPKSGVSVGTVVALTNGNYVIASFPKYVDNNDNISEYCSNYNGGGYAWSVPTLLEAIATYQIYKNQIGKDNCIKIVKDSIYTCARDEHGTISIFKGYSSCLIYARQ